MNRGPRPDDHVLVLFGATGDLARRKLLPGPVLPARGRAAPERVPRHRIGTEVVRDDRRAVPAYARQAAATFGITKPTDPSWSSFAKRLLFAAAEPRQHSRLGRSGPASGEGNRRAVRRL